MRFVGTIAQQGHQIRPFHSLILQYSSLFLLTSVNPLSTKRHKTTIASAAAAAVTEPTSASTDLTSINTTPRKRRTSQSISLITDTPAMPSNTRSDNVTNNSRSNNSSSSSSSSSWYNIDDAGIAKYMAHREVFRNATLSILVDGFRFTRPLKRYLLKSREGLVYTNKNNDNNKGGISNQQKTNSPARRGNALYSMKEIDNVNVFYLLSHFHADHYTGLNGSWRGGMIHCSRGTAELTAYKLHVNPSYLFPMEFGVTYLFSLASGQCITKWPTQEKEQNGLLTNINKVQTLSNLEICDMTNKSINKPNSNNNALLDEEGMCADGTFTVHLVPANHCPGAALFIFTSPAFGRIIHTGDLRFNSSLASWSLHAERYGGWLPAKDLQTNKLEVSSIDESVKTKEKNSNITINNNVNILIAPPFYEQFMQDNPALQAVASRVDKLFLDNTFCDPNYRFPRQWQVNQEVISTLYSLLTRPLTTTRQQGKQRSQNASFVAKHRRTNKNNKHCLERDSSVERERSIHCAVLVGSYTIGKERVALAIQDAFRSVNSASTLNRYCNVNESISTLDLVPIYTHPEKYELLRRLSYHTNHFTPVKEYDATRTRITPLEEIINVKNTKSNKRHTLREALEKSKSFQSTSMEPASLEVKEQTPEAVVKEEEELEIMERSNAGKTSELMPRKSSPLSLSKQTAGMHSIHVYKHEVCLPHWSLQQSSTAQCNTDKQERRNSITRVKSKENNHRRCNTPNINVRSSQNIKQGENMSEEEQEEEEEEDIMHYYLSIYLVPLHVLSLSNLRSATGWQYKRGRYDTESRTWLSHKEESSDSSSESESDATTVIERKHTIGNSSSSFTLLTMGAHYGIDLSLFDCVLAVEPSGWVRATRSENITDLCTLLHVPYSEHCSFDEMLSFTEFVNPLKVVPTVSELNFRKREALFVERAPRMKNGKKTTIPITRFFNKVVSSTLSVFSSHKKVEEKLEEEEEQKELEREKVEKVEKLEKVKVKVVEQNDVHKSSAYVELVECDNLSSSHISDVAANDKIEQNVNGNTNNGLEWSVNSSCSKENNVQDIKEANEIYDVSSGDDDDDKLCDEKESEEEYYFVEVE